MQSKPRVNTITLAAVGRMVCRGPKVEAGNPWGLLQQFSERQRAVGISRELENTGRYEINCGGEPEVRGKVTGIIGGLLSAHLHLALTSKSIYIALMATLTPCLKMVFWSFLSICSVVSPRKWM